MLVVETIARIRRDHLVRGVPIKKIARDLRVSKNTVRKVVLEAIQREEEKFERGRRVGLDLDAPAGLFRRKIDQRIRAEAA